MAGEQYRQLHPLYGRWNQFKQVTTNPNSGDWPNHGGRGIRLDSSFEQFLDFESWVMDNLGACPGPDYKLARINQDLDFAPGNLHWTHHRDVVRKSKRVTSKNTIMIKIGKTTKNIRDWCELNGIHYDTAITRIHKLGWRPEDAVTQPARPRLGSKNYDPKLKRTTRTQ